MQRRGQRPVAVALVAGGEEGDALLRSGHEGRAPGALPNALVQILNDGILTAHIIPGTGEIGDDVGGGHAAQRGPVNPLLRQHVFAQTLRSGMHQFHGIRGAAPLPRTASRMGRSSPELDEEGKQRIVLNTERGSKK